MSGSDKPLRVAQIGLGYWGPNLVRNLVNSNNFNIKAVSDLDSKKTKVGVQIEIWIENGPKMLTCQ